MSDRRIRILLAISDLGGGGAEREFSSLANHLSRERFEIHVCFWRSTAVYTIAGDIPVHLVKKERPWHVFGAVLGYRRLIDDLKPDVVFSQLHYVNMVMGAALAQVEHKPKWVCRQVNDPRREMRGLAAVWARRSLARADRALGASVGVTTAMIKHLRLDPKRVETVVNAVDVATIERLAAAPLPITRPRGRFVVLHAGRLTRQKNQALLLRAFHQLNDLDAELWILGEGEMFDQLQKLAASLKIEDRVRWLGFWENPYPFFRAADCFALTSDNEGLPNVLIESMICGTPAVSTLCEFGPDELIDDGSTGYLTPVGDPTAFGLALRALADDPSAARIMGERGRDLTRSRFETAAVTAEYETLFETLVLGKS